MRILQIDVNCKNSSTGKSVYDLYSNLSQQGETVAVCYGRSSEIYENNIYKFGLDWETNLHAVQKKKAISVVWIFYCEYMYTGKCGYAYDCEKWKSECRTCPAVTDYPKSILFDHTRAMFKQKRELLSNMNFTIVTPSQWLADRVKQNPLEKSMD